MASQKKIFKYRIYVSVVDHICISIYIIANLLPSRHLHFGTGLRMLYVIWKQAKILALASCEIKIHFSIQTTKYLMKYTTLCFQISGRLTIPLLNMITKFNQVS